VLSLIVAAYYGKYYGFLILLFSIFVITLPLPYALDRVYGNVWNLDYWRRLQNIALIPLALTLLGIYVFGIIRDYYVTELDRRRDRLKNISREAGLLKRNLRGITRVNHELEERVSRQQDSVTSLHSHIQLLYSLNLSKALDAILEIVNKFSSANKASIWVYEPESKDMRLAAQLGWSPEEEARTVIPVEDSVEGWVLRNSMMFSIRMLLQYENLSRMDTSRNILTLPISAGTKIWGILNIEEMPFVKYNQYTEKLLAMILALAAPALEKAIEYESVITQKEIHPETGLPSFTHFYSLLDKELQRLKVQKATLSVIIIELVNFAELVNEFGEKKVCTVLGRMAHQIGYTSRSRANLFHYKSDGQLVILFPNLDYDGASLFCLEVLSTINDNRWEIDEKEIALETAIGYAAAGEEQINADNMLEIAENLLEMQKV
jgi:diguanylate cyclase (GGDEF)-like protein